LFRVTRRASPSHRRCIERITAPLACEAYEWPPKEMTMKKTTIVSLLVLAMLLVPVAAFADGAATFDAKCKACHGADGKKLVKADLTSAAIQGKSDADLVKFLTTDAKHKSKVADEAGAKELVAFLKALKK
jgi:mono/diheme cytochrome c family protein